MEEMLRESCVDLSQEAVFGEFFHCWIFFDGNAYV